MVREAWRATVHGVTKSQTWLNDWARTHSKDEPALVSYGSHTIWASYYLFCIYPRCCHKLHPFPPDICSNFTEHYFSNTPSSLMTPQYFLKIIIAWNNIHLFIQLAGSFSVNKNISELLTGRLLSCSLSVFNVSSLVLSCVKDLI